VYWIDCAETVANDEAKNADMNKVIENKYQRVRTAPQRPKSESLVLFTIRVGSENLEDKGMIEGALFCEIGHMSTSLHL